MSLIYGVGGATSALTVVGLCKPRIDTFRYDRELIDLRI